MAQRKSERQKQLGTLIALLIATQIILHFCFDVVDKYFFSDFTVTTDLAIISAILLLVVLFFREELVLGLFGGGGSGSRKKKGGVRNGNRRSPNRRGR